MFNGIIESIGLVTKISKQKENLGKNLEIETGFTNFDNIPIGASIAIDGVCATVIKKKDKKFSCFASQETLAITNLKYLKKGSRVNLEQALPYNGRVDGHLVYGHVDGTAKLVDITKKESSIFTFEINSGREYLVTKGAIAINGISLTIYQLTKNTVGVMIIPHTLIHTNLSELQLGDEVNIEFDMLGKYLKNYFEQYQKS